MTDACYRCEAPLGVASDLCDACTADAHRLAPGDFVVLLDGRPVRPSRGRPYEFRTQHAATYAAWVAYPGLAARIRVVPARVIARGLRQGRKGDCGFRTSASC